MFDCSTWVALQSTIPLILILFVRPHNRQLPIAQINHMHSSWPVPGHGHRQQPTHAWPDHLRTLPESPPSAIAPVSRAICQPQPPRRHHHQQQQQVLGLAQTPPQHRPQEVRPLAKLAQHQQQEWSVAVRLARPQPKESFHDRRRLRRHQRDQPSFDLAHESRLLQHIRIRQQGQRQ